MTTAVGASVNFVAHLGSPTLIRVRRSEPLQGLANPGVLADERLDVGLFKHGLVVVDVPELHHHPRVGHVVLVVVVVLALVVHLYPKSESLPLKLIFVVQRLDHLQAARPVVVAHHGEFVGAEARRLYDLVVKLVGLVFIVNGHSENGGVG